MNNLILHSNTIKITEALEEYIKTKVKKIYSHFEVNHLKVSIDHEHNQNVAQILIELKGKVLHLKEMGVNMYEAIDNLMKKTHEKLKQTKEKIKRKANK